MLALLNICVFRKLYSQNRTYRLNKYVVQTFDMFRILQIQPLLYIFFSIILLFFHIFDIPIQTSNTLIIRIRSASSLISGVF